jgi:hypothetical protein
MESHRKKVTAPDALPERWCGSRAEHEKAGLAVAKVIFTVRRP